MTEAASSSFGVERNTNSSVAIGKAVSVGPDPRQPPYPYTKPQTVKLFYHLNVRRWTDREDEESCGRTTSESFA